MWHHLKRHTLLSLTSISISPSPLDPAPAPAHRCKEDVNECERGNPEGECENGGVCVNTRGSFYCDCAPGFVGPRCGLRPVVVPDMQAGHAMVGKEELIGIAAVLLVIVALCGAVRGVPQARLPQGLLAQ